MSLIRTSILVFVCSSIVSCGGASLGGGDDGPAPVIEPTVSFSGPSTISDFSSCSGNSWDNCITLTASVSDPQNRVIDKNWVVRSNSYWEWPSPVRTGDTVISCPAYCGEAYSLQLYYEMDYTMPSSSGTGTFTSSDWTYKDVYVNELQCASGIGVDGYIIDADVFVDLNNNLTMDECGVCGGDGAPCFDYIQNITINKLKIKIGPIKIIEKVQLTKT